MLCNNEKELSVFEHNPTSLTQMFFSYKTSQLLILVCNSGCSESVIAFHMLVQDSLNSGPMSDCKRLSLASAPVFISIDDCIGIKQTPV